jgi:hypothetical protein
VILDMARIFADKIIGQFFHGGCDGMRAALYDRFAPAADSLIGIDAYEQPAWRNEKGGETSDLHALVP